MKRKAFFVGVGVLIFVVFIGFCLWINASKETRSEVRALTEILVDDCPTAEMLLAMASQAANDYRPWPKDPCGERTAVECQVFLLRASIEAGCVHSTLAECRLGEVLFSLGNHSDAIELLESCNEKVDSATYLWYLAVSYHKTGLESKAEKTRHEINRVREQFPSRVDDILGPLPF
ncbi:MAG: hypothetical protein DRJ65_08345 [Acidobacteria bacterium]|nr:MAG: hypothetical protein DRJ65_08345 [Acidobacteriota bacterium]